MVRGNNPDRCHRVHGSWNSIRRMRRITVRTKLTFVSSLASSPFPPRPPVALAAAPDVSGFTRELTQPGDNAKLENCTFDDTTQQVSIECPDTDLQLLRFYRRIRLVESICDVADPLVSPLRCCRSSLCFHMKGEIKHESKRPRACDNKSIIRQSAFNDLL